MTQSMAIGRLLRPLVFLFVVISSFHVIAADLYRGRTLLAEGRILSVFINNSGATDYELARRFRLHTDGIRFLVRLEKHGENFDTDYIEQAFDGTNTYFLSTMPTWVKAQRDRGATVGDNVGDASITAVPVPQNPFADSCGVLWCAFLAGERFRSDDIASGDLYFTPFPKGTKPIGGDYTESEFPKCATMWSGINEDGRLLLDQISLAVEIVGESGRMFTNVVFRTLEWQVVDGSKLPRLAEAQVLRRAEDGSARIRAKYKMTVESAEFSNLKPSYVPELPGLTTVREERFNSPNLDGAFHFGYFVTNRWATKEAVENLDQYKAAMANANMATAKISPFTIMILALVLIAGPLIYLKMRRS